jgi:hypothetical protein
VVSVGPEMAALVFYLNFYLLNTMIRNALAYSREKYEEKQACSLGLIWLAKSTADWFFKKKNTVA